MYERASECKMQFLLHIGRQKKAMMGGDKY